MTRQWPRRPGDEIEEIERTEGRILARIEQMEKRIMATLAELVAAEGQEATEIGQLVSAFNAQAAAIAALQAQIAALTPGTLTAEQQAQIDATFADIQTQTAAITAVLPAPPAA